MVKEVIIQKKGRDGDVVRRIRKGGEDHQWRKEIMKETLLLVGKGKERRESLAQREKRMRETHREEQRPEDVEVDGDEEIAGVDEEAGGVTDDEGPAERDYDVTEDEYSEEE